MTWSELEAWYAAPDDGRADRDQLVRMIEKHAHQRAMLLVTREAFDEAIALVRSTCERLTGMGLSVPYVLPICLAQTEVQAGEPAQGLKTATALLAEAQTRGGVGNKAERDNRKAADAGRAIQAWAQLRLGDRPAAEAKLAEARAAGELRFDLWPRVLSELQRR